MTFPLLYIALPFALLFLVWLIYSFFALVHAFKYGKYNSTIYFGTVLFLAVSIIISFVAFGALQKVDWAYQIQIEN